MTNEDKGELRNLCKKGYSFKDIREIVSCSTSTIKSYMKIFSPKKRVDIMSGSESEQFGGIMNGSENEYFKNFRKNN